MEELYWISVIGNVGTFLLVCYIALTILSVLLFAIGMSEDDDCDIPFIIFCKKHSVRMLIISICIGVITVFLPQKKDLYIIYGLGAIMDHIKDNDTAKPIPDNALKALDVYFNHLIEQPHEDNER